MRLQKTSAAVALVAALSLTACDDGSSGSGPAASASAAAPSGTTGAVSPGVTGGPSASDSPGGTGATGATGATGGSGAGYTQASAPAPAALSGGTCRTANLSFSSSGGMAEGEVLINLENTGSASCSMRGFPGLDLTSEDGTVSAGRSSGRSVPTVTLAPGEGTNFSLHFPPDVSGGSGVTFTSALVTPPDETRSHRMPLSVGIPADSGSASRITVDPVGSGK
ncbi:DUF4232 domain-containing protein [Streptomyces pratensis]|uniref:DUF4232 domain-containing protein n=1 Tax=Streptomyces pratensis TaxID=1169025 RepID=UPI001933F5BD|nr:DUF4232 domain-containing protein [Streptomyces pratensis]